MVGFRFFMDTACLGGRTACTERCPLHIKARDLPLRRLSYFYFDQTKGSAESLGQNWLDAVCSQQTPTDCLSDNLDQVNHLRLTVATPDVNTREAMRLLQHCAFIFRRGIFPSFETWVVRRTMYILLGIIN